MAEFPPNLDDGELYLPSDIFLTEISSQYNPCCHLSCMEDLAGHFASLSFLQSYSPSNPSRTPLKSPLNSQRVKMAVGDLSASHLPGGYVGLNGGGGVGGARDEIGQRLFGYGTVPFLARSEPFCEIQSQPQVNNSYLESRPRLLQRQRNPYQNRIYPFQRSGFGLGGGRGKESGGTGVFHPRIIDDPTAGSPVNVDSKKKQGARNRQQLNVTTTQERTSMRSVSKQEDCYYYLPPEMGLPQDWTY